MLAPQVTQRFLFTCISSRRMSRGLLGLASGRALARRASTLATKVSVVARTAARSTLAPSRRKEVARRTVFASLTFLGERRHESRP
ncbi:hypothetical protein B1218_37615 [Pseudomonas ogarae]|nr:hypothetical protein B1218_37615 [Pseudomonas ogarae]